MRVDVKQLLRWPLSNADLKTLLSNSENVVAFMNLEGKQLSLPISIKGLLVPVVVVVVVVVVAKQLQLQLQLAHRRRT